MLAVGAAAAPAIGLIALLPGIASWVYLIAGLIAAGREKRAPARFPDTGDIVTDTLARIRAMTLQDAARMDAIIDAEENGKQYPQQGF